MALYFEDECVDCPTEIGCLGSTCRYKNVPHLSCDKCKEDINESDRLYDSGHGWLCLSCLLEEDDFKYLEDDVYEYDGETYEFDKLIEFIDDNFISMDYEHLPEPEEPDWDD